ncbi:MAG: GNAT family N-acetyltransferase [Fimbriimonadales bacterium]|nr:GNAT family N-acetyltransferase [Fimbriimonadales bacterium]
MLRTHIVTDADWADRLRGPWSDLFGSAASATPFQSWEWQSLWWRWFGGRKRPWIVALFEGRDLVGLAPFAVTRGPWKALRWIGTGASDYLHSLARPGYETQVAYATWDAVRESRDHDLADLHQVRETHPLAAIAAGGACFEQARCLVLDLPPTYEEYLAGLGKSLRYDARRLDRGEFASGAARVRFVGPDETDHGMEVLLATHRKRWRDRGLPGAFVGRRSEAFHRQWARAASERGWLRLGVLEFEGQAIGAIYAMAVGGACYFYQCGFDPSRKSLSPGTLLVAATIRHAIGEGLRTFDFLRGDEPYKRRWKPQNVFANVRWLLPKSGLAGAVARGWNRAGWRIEERLRARLEGRGLVG